MRQAWLEQKEKKWVRHHSSNGGGFFCDVDGFTQAQKNMIVEWWHYAMAYYKNLLRKFPYTPDDVLFDGVEDALIYAVRTWEPDKGANFKTWFKRACSMSVYRSWVRYRNDYLCNYSRDATLREDLKSFNSDNGGKRSTFDALGLDGYTQWEDQCVDRISLDEVMGCLNPKEREIIKRVYVYNEKQSDIARSMGVTRQRVSFIHGEAIRKCREAAKEG